MMQFNKTVPLAPEVSQQTTVVPLSVDGVLSELPVARDQVLINQNMLDPDKPIYIGNFEIDEATAPGSKVYTWNSKNPMNNFFNATIQADGTYNQIIPKSLFLSHFSRYGRVSWEITFSPVKIADCRVELDVVYFYGTPPDDTLLQTTLNNDSVHFKLDDMDCPMSFVPPFYWGQHNIHMNSPLYQILPNTELTQFLPASYPTVTVGVYQRTRYIPNNLQMSNFKVMVFVKPIIEGLSGFCSRSVVSNVEGTGGIPTVTYVSQPYYYTAANFSFNLKKMIHIFVKDAENYVKMQKKVIQNLPKGEKESLETSLKNFETTLKSYKQVINKFKIKE